MMQGFVNQYCEAILPIVVKNNNKSQFIDAIIDTGFSGFLTLPSNIIQALGLTWKGRDIANTARLRRGERKFAFYSRELYSQTNSDQIREIFICIFIVI